MKIEQLFVLALKENLLTDQGWEYAGDHLYGKDGVLLCAYKDYADGLIDFATISVEDDLKDTMAYKFLLGDKSSKGRIGGDENDNIFYRLFADGSALVYKDVTDISEDGNIYLYKEWMVVNEKLDPVTLSDKELGISEAEDEDQQPLPFVNLTPHPIVLNGVTILPEEIPARCTTSTEVIDNIAGIEIRQKTFGEVTGLPEPQDGKYFIVSSIVASALNGSRDDVFVTDGAIRDESGRIVGCTGLAKV